MAGIFLTTSNVSKPQVTSLPLTAFNAFFEPKIPLIAGSSIALSAFLGLQLGVLFETNNPNPVLINGSPFKLPNLMDGTAAINEAGVVTPSSLPVRIYETDRVFLKGSSIQIDRKPAEEHSLLFKTLAGDESLFNTLTGEITGEITDTVDLVSDTESTISMHLNEDSLVFKKNGVTLHSEPLTYAINGGTVGTMSSSGVAQGSSLPLSSSDTLTATASGNITVASVFGSTTYEVVVGTVMTLAGAQTAREIAIESEETVTESLVGHFVGGVGTKSYQVVQGSLPQGLSFSNGALTGSTWQDGTFSFKVKVTDLYGQSQTVTYTLKVTAKLNIDYNPPPAVEGYNYSYVPSAPKAVVSSWSKAGNLPTGLTFNTVNGALEGTPTEGSSTPFVFSVTAITPAGNSETVTINFMSYPAASVSYQAEGGSAVSIADGGILAGKVGDYGRIIPQSGSGQFAYTISNGNHVDIYGNYSFKKAGDAVLSIIDVITGQTLMVILSITGQDSVVSFGVLSDLDEDVLIVDNADIITECGKKATVAFDASSFMQNFENEPKGYLNYKAHENAKITNNGKPFCMFQSLADDAWAVVDKEEGDFIASFVVTPSMMTDHTGNLSDMGIGLGSTNLQTPMAYELVVTSYSQGRCIELRRNGVYVANSRHYIEEGNTFAFGRVGNAIHVWFNDNLESTVTITEENICGLDLVVFSRYANVFFGGRIANLVYEIETQGSPSQVGDINAQTGEYEPSQTNLPSVRIVARNGSNNYRAKVRVIRRSPKESLETALIQAVPVDFWVADIERGDNELLRLIDGQPDANQIINAVHLGTLGGEATFTPNETKNDFTDDAGVTGTSHSISKYVIAGAYLQLRDFNKTSRIAAYTKVFAENGVRVMRQYSTGCKKRQRVILVWRNPFCEEGDLYDAIEFFNCVNYTMLGFGLGLQTQSSLALNIEAHKRISDNSFFDYYQFNPQFVRV